MKNKKAYHNVNKSSQRRLKKYVKYELVKFQEVQKLAQMFADHIEKNSASIAQVLQNYETHQVIADEIQRTLDLFRNLKENKKYFCMRTGEIATFLPKNQPLYSLSCFALIPSLMASKVYFRIPHSMKHFFLRLVRLLELEKYFPNVYISHKERLPFLAERSSIYYDPKSSKSFPVTDVVIFTGMSHHADKIRVVFHPETLVIVNGSGHNPLVITETANLKDSVAAAISLQLYNQGQDCAAPNTILVHKKVFAKFLSLLRSELAKIRVGQYKDPYTIVGPITDPDELTRIQKIFVENISWLDRTTLGVIKTAASLVQPTIICKPLIHGGNFTEIFAPVFFLQKYKSDKELRLYFEDARYARNAMYVTVYGKSPYISTLIGKEINGKVLHNEKSYLRNTHLHHPGVERGTQPYGGLGYAASNICIHGKITPLATLPQRDIYNYKIKELFRKRNVLRKNSSVSGYILQVKDVKKLIGMKIIESPPEGEIIRSAHQYVDSKDFNNQNNARYYELKSERVITLLDDKNVAFISIMLPREIKEIQLLHKFLKNNPHPPLEKLKKVLYDIPKSEMLDQKNYKKNQLSFFTSIYRLLLGKDAGPRLYNFLLEADRHRLLLLLDI